MTKTVLLRSRVRGNPQARFWRAVGVVTPSLTLMCDSFNLNRAIGGRLASIG
jgi:hypothetical protein